MLIEKCKTNKKTISKTNIHKHPKITNPRQELAQTNRRQHDIPPPTPPPFSPHHHYYNSN